MVYHQTTVLHYFDSGLRECLSNFGMTNARLHPYGVGLFCEHVLQMRRDVLRPPKDVYQINFIGYVDKLAIDRLPQDRRDAGIVDGNRNNLEPGRVKIPGDVERGLARLCFSLDAQHSDSFCAAN